MVEFKSGAPVIVLGAGRSGTKMLRGILASHPETVCFPREINYIWRHGNANYPTDELKPEHARPEVIRYIRERFDRLSRGHDDAWVVEKTCANALRVGFVHRVFPEAYIIHLIRDGRAVAESARRRWIARSDLRYLLEKLRWVPVGDILYYAIRYLRYQLGRLYSSQGAESSWGPRFDGIDDLIQEKALIEVCGLQWKSCVRAAEASLSDLPSAQTLTIRYEDLVEDPIVATQGVFDRVGLSFVQSCRDYVLENISASYIDKWRDRLSKEDLSRLMPHIESELTQQGYEPI
jgi:hypothetical protein